jgi:Leucine-rich repeat (LRR) protein
MSKLKTLPNSTIKMAGRVSLQGDATLPLSFSPFWVNAISPITNYDIQGSATIREDDNNGSYGLSTSDLNGINSIATYEYYEGNVNLAGSTSLTTINLAYVDSVDLSNCTSLERVSFTYQWGIGLDINFSGCSALTTINAFYVNQLNIDGTDSLQTLSLLYGLFSDLDVSGKTSLVSLSLSYNNNLQALNASDCTNLSTINFPTNLTLLGDLKLDNTAITNLNFGYTFIGVSIDFSIAGCTNLTSVNCYYSYMPEHIIDGILIDLDTNGASNGYVNLKTAPWSPTPPSAAGVVAVQNLTAKGWNVIVDAGVPEGTLIWSETNSSPAGYSYVGGTITEHQNILIIDDVTLLQEFSSSGANVAGTVNLNGAASLTNLQIQQGGITGVDLTGCTLLSTLNLAANDLTSIVGLTTLTSLTSLNVGASVFLILGSQLTSLSNLNTLNVSFGLNTGSTLDLNGLNNLQTINANFSYFGEVILDNAGNFLSADFSNCTSMTSFSAANANIGTLNLSNSNNITTIGAGTGGWYFASDINLSNCNLSAANLNIILGSLAGAMTPTNSGGTLRIGGNSKDSTTFGYIATIEANGWTVIEDPAPSTLWSSWTSKPEFTSTPADRASGGAGGAGANWSEDGTNLMVAPSNALTSFVSSSPVGGTVDATNFTSLTQLNLNNTSVTSVNLSGLTNLSKLYLEFCTLSTLDLSGLSNLSQLNVYGNTLTTLDLSGLTNLTFLSCSANSLNALDLSGLTNLIHLECNSNPFTTLDLSELINLEQFFCGSGNITTIDLSANTKLWRVQMNASSILTSINLPVSVSNVSIYSSPNFNVIDVSGLSNLSFLDITSNQATSLNISGATSLSRLYARNNQFADSSVNDILITLDGNGLNNGHIRIDGTGNAAPTGAGLSAKVNLQNKNWTVLTN